MVIITNDDRDRDGSVYTFIIYVCTRWEIMGKWLPELFLLSVNDSDFSCPRRRLTAGPTLVVGFHHKHIIIIYYILYIIY